MRSSVPNPVSSAFLRYEPGLKQHLQVCGDACPIFPGKRYLDWKLNDPAGRLVEEVRDVRDDIDRRVRALLAELLPEGRDE